MTDLPLAMPTPMVLSTLGISDTKWRDLRKMYDVKPVCRGKQGYIYRGADVARIFTPTGQPAHDPIMEGLKDLG